MRKLWRARRDSLPEKTPSPHLTMSFRMREALIAWVD